MTGILAIKVPFNSKNDIGLTFVDFYNQQGEVEKPNECHKRNHLSKQTYTVSNTKHKQGKPASEYIKC